jgi:phosphoribosylcarboxyaminoimidazole (NCAIR) mutase
MEEAFAEPEATEFTDAAKTPEPVSPVTTAAMTAGVATGATLAGGDAAALLGASGANACSVVTIGSPSDNETLSAEV